MVGLAYIVVMIWDHDAFVRWMSEASAVPFFVAMAVLPAIGIPMSPFMIVAGATFGVWIALVGSIAAMAANLCIGYAIAHSKLRPRIESLFERFDYKIPDFAAGGRAAWRFAAAVKITPGLPTAAKMYVVAVTAVPFPIYFAVLLAISSAFAAVWIVLGDSLFTHDISIATMAALAIVVLVVVAIVWWRKRRAVSGDDALSVV